MFKVVINIYIHFLLLTSHSVTRREDRSPAYNGKGASLSNESLMDSYVDKGALSKK